MSNNISIYPEAAALRALAKHCSETLGKVQTAQSADCPAARELSGANAVELLETAYSQGALLAGVARDQTEALARALTEPVLTFAPWPISRNVVEASAIGAWLWEPAIGFEERIARSIAFRYEGLEQQVKGIRSTGKDVSAAEERLERLEKQGQALGYKVILNKKGKRIAVAKQMLSATDLATSVLNAETDYRVLSAVVHGHAWALVQLGLQESGAGPSQVVGGALQEFRKSSPRAAVVWACCLCADALYRIHEHRARLFGVGTSNLESAFRLFEEEILKTQAAS